MHSGYLNNIKKIFADYRLLGEKTFHQISDEDFFVQLHPQSNSIAIIVNHLAGNMLSRWTDFLHSDGEKEWRHRDTEFENNLNTRAEVIGRWNEGWKCLEDTLKQLQPEDLEKTVYIRSEGHKVFEAINRQIAHYSYHIGQIVFTGTVLVGDNWKSLSIPKGKSQIFNQSKMGSK